MIYDSLLLKSPRITATRPFHAIPVLIEVPTITDASVISWHSSASVDLRPRRRRRLRREVRLLGYTFLTAMILKAMAPWAMTPASTPLSPLMSVGTGLSRSDQRATIAPPLVSISIEPLSPAPVGKANLAVVLPGYLLPDDGPAEEPTHAGY